MPAAIRSGVPAIGEIGYDGQFFYYIAVEPGAAAPALDAPVYRYTRILYPMVAWALAGGVDAAIPGTLLVVNLLSLAATTTLLALALRRRGISPTWALLVGFYPGLFVALQRDLAEPLMVVLLAAALYLFDAPRRRLVPIALLLAAAALTRETALIFALALAGATLLEPSGTGEGVVARARRTWPAAAFLLGVAALPLLAWRIALTAWLGGPDHPDASAQLIPLGGLVEFWPWHNERVDSVLGVVVPGLIALAAAAVVLGRSPYAWRAWLVVVSVLGLIFFIPTASYADYYATGRITAPVVLAAVFLLTSPRARLGTGWLWLCALFWMAPWYDFVPQAFNGVWVTGAPPG